MIGPSGLAQEDSLVNPDDPNDAALNLGVDNILDADNPDATARQSPYQGPADNEAGDYTGPSPYDSPYAAKASDKTGAEEQQSQDPTKSDPAVQKYQKRIDEIDEELKNRPNSLGGIISAFSPNGDRRYQELHNERNALNQSLNNAEKNAVQFSKSRFQKVGQGGTMVDTQTGQPIYTNTMPLQVATEKDAAKLEYLKQHGVQDLQLQQLKASGALDRVNLTGNWAYDKALLTTAARSSDVATQQEGATERTGMQQAGATGRTNAQLQAGAGKTATQSDNDQLNSLTRAAHEALQPGGAGPEAAATLFKEAQTIRARMTTRSAAPAPQAAAPGAAAAGAAPAPAAGGAPTPAASPAGNATQAGQVAEGQPALKPNGQPYPEGTLSGSGKLIVNGGGWQRNPAYNG